MGFSKQEYWSGFYVLLQGIFLTQGTNPGLPHCRQILYPQSYAGFGETKRDRGNSFCFVELTINSREMDINYQNKLGLLLLPQGTSLMAQVVKNLPAMQEIQV